MYICAILFQKLRGAAGSKRYGMYFSLSYEGKEENPRNYNGLRVRERKNTFHITLNRRQLLSFGTYMCHSIKPITTAQTSQQYFKKLTKSFKGTRGLKSARI